MSRTVPEIQTSMVVATLGRSHELEGLFNSLVGQDRDDFEVIVVDQNDDDRLAPVLMAFAGKLEIIHLRTDKRGVCRARNLGAARARGRWLIFPDDDCWYPTDFLSRVDALRAAHPADFYCGRPTDTTGRTIMGDFATEPMPIERPTIWTTLIEWMLVVKKPAFDEAGGFDIAIGPGSGTPWGAYEIQDLALKLLATDRHGWYDPAFTGHHPEDRGDQTTPAAVAKMRVYSSGLGYVMRKHGYRVRGQTGHGSSFMEHCCRPLVRLARRAPYDDGYPRQSFLRLFATCAQNAFRLMY